MDIPLHVDGGFTGIETSAELVGFKKRLERNDEMVINPFLLMRLPWLHVGHALLSVLEPIFDDYSINDTVYAVEIRNRKRRFFSAPENGE